MVSWVYRNELIDEGPNKISTGLFKIHHCVIRYFSIEGFFLAKGSPCKFVLKYNFFCKIGPWNEILVNEEYYFCPNKNNLFRNFTAFLKQILHLTKYTGLGAEFKFSAPYVYQFKSINICLGCKA